MLLGYFDEMHEQTVRYLSSLSEDYLDRIVRWKPLVMVAVRLVSAISDDPIRRPGRVHSRRLRTRVDLRPASLDQVTAARRGHTPKDERVAREQTGPDRNGEEVADLGSARERMRGLSRKVRAAVAEETGTEVLDH